MTIYSKGQTRPHSQAEAEAGQLRVLGQISPSPDCVQSFIGAVPSPSPCSPLQGHTRLHSGASRLTQVPGTRVQYPGGPGSHFQREPQGGKAPDKVNAFPFPPEHSRSLTHQMKAQKQKLAFPSWVIFPSLTQQKTTTLPSRRYIKLFNIRFSAGGCSRRGEREACPWQLL